MTRILVLGSGRISARMLIMILAQGATEIEAQPVDGMPFRGHIAEPLIEKPYDYYGEPRKGKGDKARARSEWKRQLSRWKK